MSWVQVILECADEDAPVLSELLSEHGAVAVTLQDNADQPLYEPPPGATPLWEHTRILALFPASWDIESAMAQVRTARAPAELPAYKVEQLEDKDWTRAWMDDFKPMRFGDRLWIVPSWHAAPDENAVNILLDPGLAFGTGTHPTTRLCLEWLDAHPPAGTVIDYGCGSGILAIAAARLGAEKVWATDNDPQALIATRENAARNQVTGRLETLLPDQLPPALVADVLLANILAKPLISLAPRFARLLRPGGSVVLSGILPEQGEMVASAYAGDFEMNAPAEFDGWVRLEGTRK